MGLEGRSVLFISYNGMLEPLGQSQVIPYLRQLAKRGVKFTLLSFEKPYAFDVESVRRVSDLTRELFDEGIEWHKLRYHQRPSLPATAYDVAVGIRRAGQLVQRNSIELVHARGHIPATIALALKRKFGVKMIFDLRGLMAEEYVDALHWPKDGLRFRISKAAERRIFGATDAVVTLTQRIWPIIKEWEGLRNRSVHHTVIPCCVDLSQFNFSETQRSQRRSELGLCDRFTLVYSGSLDGWYLTEDMADFFAQFVKKRTDAHLLWLTTGRAERVRQLMVERGITEDKFTIRCVAPTEVSSYLAAGDAGISFIKRCISKIASSPTKNGEYLACGLPIIINSGIGDSDALVTEWHAGVMVEDFGAQSFANASAAIEQLAADPTVRKRARHAAEKLFDLQSVGGERYAALYQRILDAST